MGEGRVGVSLEITEEGFKLSHRLEPKVLFPCFDPRLCVNCGSVTAYRLMTKC